MILFEILLSRIRSISTRNIKNTLKSIKFENAWIYFSYLFIEREVLLQTSLTFDEPVGESEVESLLLDAINNGSLGHLKVDTFFVGSTIPGVYKNSYDDNFECT